MREHPRRFRRTEDARGLCRNYEYTPDGSWKGAGTCTPTLRQDLSSKSRSALHPARSVRTIYYASREIVPNDMLDDVKRAKIVITNFHAFKLRERVELSKGGRQLLQGRTGEELNTQETDGQMIQRVMKDLMGMKSSFDSQFETREVNGLWLTGARMPAR
jgi:hypothetical protein